jgi:hypothetical protein
MKKVIKTERDFAEWFKKNYEKLGYSKIIRGDISRCPDFIMLKDGKEVGVELETIASNFLAHKHDLKKVDEVVCLVKDVELGLPVKEVKDVKYQGKIKVTLSIDSRVYDDFKEHCEKNAIMLSKKIELIMKELLKKKLIIFFLALLLVVTVEALSVSFESPTPTGNISGNSIYVNFSTSGEEHYALLDFNKSLISWIRFDDANEDQIFDLSSYSTNGSMKNGGYISSQGYYGASALFDGYDDYVNFSDSLAFDSISVNNRLTACAWIKPFSTKNFWAGKSGHPATGSMGVLGQWRAGGISQQNNRSFGIVEEVVCGDGKYGFFISSNGLTYSNACTDSTVPLNNWTQICGTFNGSTVKMYVNGQQQTSTGSASGIYNSPAPFQIGTYAYSYNSSMDSDIYFNGSIDDVTLFNRALDLQEVRALYNASVYKYEHNFTSLSNGSYSFTGYTVNRTASRESISRIVTVGANITNMTNSSIPFAVSFVSPTPTTNLSENSIYVNLSVNGSGNLYSILDFDRDLIFWMRMDDTNSSGSPTDRSSYGNNGTLKFGATINSNSGYFENGVSFNGSQFIEVRSSTDFDTVGTSDKMTLCSWFKAGSHGADYTGIVGRYDTESGNNDRQFLLAKNNSDNAYGFFLSSFGITFNAKVMTNNALNTNQWYHLCGTYNGSLVLLYLNGQQQSQTATLTTGIKDSINAPLFIGKFGRNTSEFNGSIDEVVLFNRALTIEEIRSLYNSATYAYEHNFTSLATQNHTFTGYGINSSGSLLSVTRTISTGVSVGGDTFPQIILNSPANGETFLSYIIPFNITVSDDYRLENVSLWGNWSGWHLNETNSSEINGEYLFVKNLTSYGEGTYKWGVTAWDNASQKNVSENRTFTINIPEDLPEITLGMPPKQEKGAGQIFKINLTTNNPADLCWFSHDNGTTNISMISFGAQYFYYEDLTAGIYNATFYCQNSYGISSLNAQLEFRRAVFIQDDYYINSQGLKIYFDFGFNRTSETARAIIIPDSWTSDKDDTWVVQTETLYVDQGYVAVPIETRGKGLSQGQKDALGWECLDIYELTRHLESTEPYKSLIESEKYYISGASGAGGKTGVCSAKYPDLFIGAFSAVGVLNLTRWWYSNPPGYFASIGDRVGCTPPQCPEAYFARDASFLNYNSQTPIKLVSNADDASVTIECSRDYNRSMVQQNKTGLYSEFPTGGHSTYRFSESLGWFANYTSLVYSPSSGDLRIGGYVQTKNFSIFLNEVNVSHIAFVTYNLSELQDTFNVSTQGFNGTFNLTLFNLEQNENYDVNVEGSSTVYSSNSLGSLSTSIHISNYSSVYVTISPAGEYCGDTTCNNGETCSSCPIDCGVCLPNNGGTGGSGGGGSGGSSTISRTIVELPKVIPKMDYENVPQVLIRPGFSENIAFVLSNTGNKFLNNCTILGQGQYSSWISRSNTFSLSPGEKTSIGVSVAVPRETISGEVSAELIVQCNEFGLPIILPLNIIAADFEFDFLSYEREGANLKINYSITDLTKKGIDVSIEYSLLDFDNISRAKGKGAISVQPGLHEDYSLIFELPKDSFGEFTLLFNVSTVRDSFQTSKIIFLPSSQATGLAISDSNKRTLSVLGVALLVLACAFLVWRICKKRKSINLKGQGNFFVFFEMLFWLMLFLFSKGTKTRRVRPSRWPSSSAIHKLQSVVSPEFIWFTPFGRARK